MSKRKNDVKYHEVLKQASIYCYRKDNAQIPAGYRVLETAENKQTGFYAEAITNGKDTIIAYRGTERSDRKDLENDVAMAHSDIPAQASDAVKFHDKIKRENQNMEVTVTGHSLGGSLAEIVSTVRGTTAVTFNAYGVKDMFKTGTKLKEDNIVNYVSEKDPITMVNGENHIGEIYAVPSEGNGLGAHVLEKMGSLSARTKKTPEEIKEVADREYPKYARVKGAFSSALETRNIYRDRAKAILSKDKQAQSGEPSPCAGSYPVSGYTRSDGREVDDYIRTCGAKHGR